MDKPVAYTFYAITKPTRTGRRMIWKRVYATMGEAVRDYMSRWPSPSAGRRQWQQCLANGYRIERITVTLGDDNE